MLQNCWRDFLFDFFKKLCELFFFTEVDSWLELFSVVSLLAWDILHQQAHQTGSPRDFILCVLAGSPRDFVLCVLAGEGECLAAAA